MSPCLIAHCDKTTEKLQEVLELLTIIRNAPIEAKLEAAKKLSLLCRLLPYEGDVLVFPVEDIMVEVENLINQEVPQ